MYIDLKRTKSVKVRIKKVTSAKGSEFLVARDAYVKRKNGEDVVNEDGKKVWSNSEYFLSFAKDLEEQASKLSDGDAIYITAFALECPYEDGEIRRRMRVTAFQTTPPDGESEIV